MGRTVKVYDDRRTEILSAAQELFFSKGYEATTVQEIIDAVGIAKGTFYHYFESKVDLLDALIASMTEQQLQNAQAILNEEIEHESWFSEFLGEGPSGHFMRRGETSPFVSKFLR